MVITKQRKIQRQRRASLPKDPCCQGEFVTPLRGGNNNKIRAVSRDLNVEVDVHDRLFLSLEFLIGIYVFILYYNSLRVFYMSSIIIILYYIFDLFVGTFGISGWLVFFLKFYEYYVMWMSC